MEPCSSERCAGIEQEAIEKLNMCNSAYILGGENSLGRTAEHWSRCLDWLWDLFPWRS